MGGRRRPNLEHLPPTQNWAALLHRRAQMWCSSGLFDVSQRLVAGTNRYSVGMETPRCRH